MDRYLCARKHKQTVTSSPSCQFDDGGPVGGPLKMSFRLMRNANGPKSPALPFTRSVFDCLGLTQACIRRSNPSSIRRIFDIFRVHQVGQRLSPLDLRTGCAPGLLRWQEPRLAGHPLQVCGSPFDALRQVDYDANTGTRLIYSRLRALS